MSNDSFWEKWSESRTSQAEETFELIVYMWYRKGCKRYWRSRRRGHMPYIVMDISRTSLNVANNLCKCKAGVCEQNPFHHQEYATLLQPHSTYEKRAAASTSERIHIRTSRPGKAKRTSPTHPHGSHDRDPPLGQHTYPKHWIALIRGNLKDQLHSRDIIVIPSEVSRLSVHDNPSEKSMPTENSCLYD